jgi:CheY-like chemotaxis protein
MNFPYQSDFSSPLPPFYQSSFSKGIRLNNPGENRKIEIFLVEDNVPDLILMMKYLKECPVNHNVNTARDGREALNYLYRVNGYEKAKKPDIVLLDLSLPYQSGFDILREVKGSPALRTIKVIILTGSELPESDLKARQLKADDFLVKPKDLPDFDALIKYLEETWFKKLLDLKKDEDGLSTAKILE